MINAIRLGGCLHERVKTAEHRSYPMAELHDVCDVCHDDRFGGRHHSADCEEVRAHFDRLAGSVFGGIRAAVLLLPLSGLFMSVVYPTLDSKGISYFPKSEHGAFAGVILFFICGGAVLGPLAMAAIIETLGAPKYVFLLATWIAALLFVGLAYNWLR